MARHREVVTTNRRRRAHRWVPYLGSGVVALVAGLLVASLPHLVGATWGAIAASLSAVPVLTLAGLVVLWLAGLLVHVPVQRAAMPGLSTRQALTLNLGGSAVSNVLPFGGPVGMGLGFGMARDWGFAADRFASYTVSTNLWNAVGKFVASLVILTVAGAWGLGLPGGVTQALVFASLFIAVVAGASALVLRTQAATDGFGRLLDRALARLRPGIRPDVCVDWLTSSRRELLTAVRAGWRTMSAGVLLYLALQAALLGACLASVGAGAGVAVVAVAFAIERLISLAPVTPGAAGVAELGTVAALHFFGINPVAAAAGVLLYRILVFAVEIPVGGLVALAWWSRRRRHPIFVPDEPAPGATGERAVREGLAA